MTRMTFTDEDEATQKAMTAERRAQKEAELTALVAESDERVTLRGVLVARNKLGKAAFWKVRTDEGEVEVYLHSFVLGLPEFRAIRDSSAGDVVTVTALVKQRCHLRGHLYWMATAVENESKESN